MSVTQTPTTGLPTAATTLVTSFIPGTGETESQEWTGTAADCYTKYSALKSQALIGGIPGNNIRQIDYKKSNGRGTVTVQFGRKPDTQISGLPPDVVVVEELAALDIIRDVYAAPYFTTGGTCALTDDEVIAVRKAVSLGQSEAEIPSFASWSTSQKQLKYHLAHGQESYYEVGFVLRRSESGMITSPIKQTFTGINTVVTAPTFKSPMDKLIAALPTGEWLYRPPEVEFMGGGKWRVTQEWSWAEKWSKMYGGTWGL